MDTSLGHPSGRRHAATACRRSLVSLAALLLVGVAFAQGAPAWVVGADGTGAYVEAFAYPATMTQEETAIFVICDPETPSGLNVRLWIGSNAAPPEEADGMVRLGQGEVQRYPWYVGGAAGDRATLMYLSDLERFLADLRSGGTMAIRLMLVPGAPDANQPTFQYDVSGFDAVERQLACGGVAAAPTAPDPFAAVPADPFAAAPAPDPFAAPAPAAPAAPAAPVSPRSRAAAPPTTPPTPAPPAPPAPAAPPTRAPLPPLPPPPSQMAPPPAAAPAAVATGDWYLFPSAIEVAIDVADRTFGFACLDDDGVAAYLVLPGVAVATDAEGLTTFTFAYDGVLTDTDEWVFLDLGDGLYATDTTASYLIAYAVEFNDRVSVGHAGTPLLEAPGGDGFYALTQQMPCLVEEE